MKSDGSSNSRIDQLINELVREVIDVGSKKDASSEAEPSEIASKLASSIRSTIRDRLAKAKTKSAAAETPTHDLSVQDVVELAGGASDETVDVGDATQRKIGGATPTTDLGLSGPAIKIRHGRLPPDYEAIEILGQGGMGVVYKAKHKPLDRLVAVKMILSGEGASDQRLKRFQEEVLATAHLAHPNIVSVHEAGNHDGLPYLSLELVDGQSMFERLRESPLETPAAAEMLSKIARAIEYSHTQGILHRDLKPQNIMLTRDGVPKVTDFGLAKRLSDGEDLTKTGGPVGTPGYMAPEQAVGDKSIGPSADVYSLGAILYYTLTGRAPFVGPTPLETLRQVISSDPVAPSRMQPGMDRDLETICLRCLEKSPERRYASANDLADDLDRFIRHEPIVARPISTTERIQKWCRRNPRVAWLSGLAAALVMALIIGGFGSAAVINQERLAEKAARDDAVEKQKIADAQAEVARDLARSVLYDLRQYFQDKPELRPLRQELLDRVLVGVEGIYDNSEALANDTLATSAIAERGRYFVDEGEYQEGADLLLEAERSMRRLMESTELVNVDISQMNIDFSLGKAFRGLGELEKAEERFRDFLSRAEKYKRENDGRRSKDLLQDTGDAQSSLGRVLIQRGRSEEAREHVLAGVRDARELLKRSPGRIDAMRTLSGRLLVLADLYEKDSDIESMANAYEESSNMLRRIAKATRDDADWANLAIFLRNYAKSLQEKGRLAESQLPTEEAISIYRELVNRNVFKWRTRESLALLLFLNSKLDKTSDKKADELLDEAIRLLRPMMEEEPTEAQQDVLLRCLASKGLVDESIELAEMLASRNSANSLGRAAVGLALLSEQIDENRKRDEVLDRAIEFARGMFKHGFRDLSVLRNDKDFAALQKLDRYHAMLDEFEQQFANQSAK